MAKLAKANTFLTRPIWLLKIIGSWPRPKFWPILFAPTLFFMAAQVGFFFNTAPPNSTDVIQSIREMVGVSSLFWKGYFVVQKSPKIAAVYRFLDTDMTPYEKCLSPQAKKMAAKRSATARRICFWIACIYYVMMVLTILPSYVSYFSDTRETRAHVMKAGPEYAFMTSDIGFLAIAITLTFHAYIVLLGATAFDTLYVVACHSISTKAAILSAMLEDISTTLENMATRHQASYDAGTIETETEEEIHRGAPKSNLWSGNVSEEAAIYAEIKRCVQYHQKICKLKDDFEEICSTALFIAICCIVIFLALPIAQFMLVPFDLDAVVFLVIVYVFSWGYFQLSYYCSWGEQISAKSEAIADAAFSLYTAGFCSKRIQQALEMMIIRAQKPLYFEAANLFKVDNDTLLKVVQKSYSLCAFALDAK